MRVLPLLLLAAVLQDPSLFEERRLDVVPDGLHVDQVFFSEDGRSVSYSAREGQRGWMVVDGKKGEEFDWTSGLVRSADRGVTAYWAASMGRYSVVTGDQKGEDFDSGSAIVLGADGKTVIYSGMQDGKQFLVTGGRKEEFDADRPIRIVRSPDGRSVAVEGKQGGTCRVYRDGIRKGERKEELFAPCFSEDGSLFAYAVRAGGKSSWVAGGLRGDPFDEVGPLVFSPDGKTFAYSAAERGTGAFVVVGVRKGKKFSRISTEHITFSPDGKTVAYGGMTNGQVRMVVGENEGEVFDEVGYPQFSPDGKTVAYPARRGERWFAVVGEEKGEEFLGVGLMQFSPDGRTLAYRALDLKGDRYHLVANGKRVSEHTPMHLYFSPDSRVLAFLTVKGVKECFVTNGVEGPEFESISWNFMSPAGKLVYRARKNDRFCLGIGEKLFDDLDPWSWPVFSPDGTKAALGVRRGQDLWWKVVDLR